MQSFDLSIKRRLAKLDDQFNVDGIWFSNYKNRRWPKATYRICYRTQTSRFSIRRFPPGFYSTSFPSSIHTPTLISWLPNWFENHAILTGWKVMTGLLTELILFLLEHFSHTWKLQTGRGFNCTEACFVNFCSEC